MDRTSTQSSRSAPISRWRGLPASPSSGSASRCSRSTPASIGGRCAKMASTTRSRASARSCWNIDVIRQAIIVGGDDGCRRRRQERRIASAASGQEDLRRSRWLQRSAGRGLVTANVLAVLRRGLADKDERRDRERQQGAGVEERDCELVHGGIPSKNRPPAILRLIG